jgi:HSP20 family protein
MLTLDFLNEVDRLQDQMNRLFQGASTTQAVGSPALNIWSSENAIMASAELPGIDTGKLDISVNGNVLTIRGAYPEQQLKSGENWVRQERPEGSFVRVFQLPFQVETEKVDAKYRNGILYLTLPRAEAEKPKRISVKSA